MNTTQFFREIRNLIARDELDAALQQLRAFFENTPKLDEILHQSGRFASIRQQIRLGTVSHAEANLTQNQIRAALLEMLSEVEKQAAMPTLRAEMERAISIVNSKNVVVGSNISAGGNVTIGDTTTITESETSRRLRLFLYLFVPVLTIGGAYIWHRMQPLTLTVAVDNLTPNPELPFTKGTLTLQASGRNESKPIESEVIFTDIPRSESIRLHFESPGFVKMDTALALPGNQLLRLPIRRDNSIARIFGTVRDEKGNPVADAQITVQDITTRSSADGGYSLTLPSEKQRRDQQIRATKTGHVEFRNTRPIVANEPNDILLPNQ